MASAAARGSPRATLGQMIKLLQDKDLDALADLYAEDGVHELPFAPPPAPRRIEGREQVRAYFTGTLAGVALEFQRFEEVAIHDTTDPNVIVAEYDAHGVIPLDGSSLHGPKHLGSEHCRWADWVVARLLEPAGDHPAAGPATQPSHRAHSG